MVLEARVMADDDGYLSLILVFATISLMAFGGVNAVLPEMHRQVVDTHHWMTDGRFTELFAVAQAAPGPNLMVITLVGWQFGGFAGALVATLAGVAPSCLLAYFVSGVWMRHREKRWRNALKAGMIPVTVGLVASGAFVIMITVADGDWRLMAATAATAVLVFLTRIHPLIPLGAAGLLGYTGIL
jgi:chromate transporter